jgi:hypothetical protein
MKKKLLQIVTIVTMLLVTQLVLSTNPSLGTAANFVLFSTNGGVSNVGLSHLTGNVGTNNGAMGGFGNVNGGMHNANGVTAAAASDLLIAYNLLNSSIPEASPTAFIAPLMGNGQTLTPGIYSIPAEASLDGILYLDGQNNANSEFIIKIGGAFSTASLSQVVLINNTKACNVFWKVEGLVNMASGTKMKGNMVVNNAAIVMQSGVELEGRALSTTGAVSTDGVLAYTPIGCGSPVLNGPTAPDLKSVSCYALFSGNGAVTNAGVSFINGDVGTNVTLTTGFQEINVTGNIHPIPDVSTAAAAADLIDIQTYLNNLSPDIELLYPSQFGLNLVLTPHTYLLNAATVLTGTVTLNALGNADAVFVLKITGALSTSTYAKVLLTNGAQAKNVYWKITGAVEINDYSEFVGNVVANNGAINIKTGTVLLGRVLTTNGALNTAAVTITKQSACINLSTDLTGKSTEKHAIIPNASGKFIQISMLDATHTSQFVVYNATGKMMLNKTISQQNSTIETDFASGVYFYKLTSTATALQTGKFIVR